QDNIRNTQKTSTGEKVKAILANHSAAIALIFIMIIGIIFRGDVFFTYSNLMNVLMNNSFIGIISLGMTLIILTGNIDLAVGSQLALSGLVAVTLLKKYRKCHHCNIRSNSSRRDNRWLIRDGGIILQYPVIYCYFRDHANISILCPILL